VSSANPGAPHWLLALAETVLGLVLAATPVTLWIAWTPALLGGALAASLGCALLLVALHRLDPTTRDGAEAPRPRVDERFFHEMHRIAPLVHHHSLRESARFRGAMDRARRLVA
jgi:hypothetical protein